MDEFEQRKDEGLTSYAMRRRNLPSDHPAHLSSEQYEQFMRAAITAVDRRHRAIVEMLKQAGMLGARI